MPTLSISFATPQCREAFAWEGDDNDAATIARQIAKLSRQAGVPAAALTEQAVINAARLLTAADEHTVRGARDLITAFALDAKAGDGRPGAVRDYLAVYDFRCVFTQADAEGIAYGIAARARDGEGAGSA
jgi:hypothetical protein